MAELSIPDMTRESRRERRAKKSIAHRATRRAVRKAKRQGGTLHDARALMPEEVRKLTEQQLSKREQRL